MNTYFPYDEEIQDYEKDPVIIDGKAFSIIDYVRTSVKDGDFISIQFEAWEDIPYGEGVYCLSAGEYRSYVKSGGNWHYIEKTEFLNSFENYVETPRIRCDSCQIVSIQGVPCHETGCPDSWIDPATGRGYIRECKWCGSKFEPEEKEEHFCCVDCAEIYHS